MMQSMREALAWLDRLQTFGLKPGLERMNVLLEHLGHPERHLKAIHVAGTNGKGSTVQFLSHVLQEAGQAVGTFTSPHLERDTDRIAVNGKEIADDEFLDIANRVRPLTERLADSEFGAATEFEVMTVIAIVYFAQVAYPDVVIFEAGLGGRLDSTNVIHPMATIITNIAEDHIDVLGDSLEDIAKEKAGIIKSGVPVITAAEGAALDIISETARRNKAKCYRLGQEFYYRNVETLEDGERFDYASPLSRRDRLEIRLNGLHQVANAATALMTLDHLHFFFGLYLEEGEIERGLRSANIPSRFETVIEEPLVIFDGAHNPQAAHVLSETLALKYPDRPIHVVFAAFKQKNVQAMLAHFARVANEVTVTSFSDKRAHKASTLAAFAAINKTTVIENPQEAIQSALEKAEKDTVVVVTGSLYFLSEMRSSLANILE